MSIEFTASDLYLHKRNRGACEASSATEQIESRARRRRMEQLDLPDFERLSAFYNIINSR
jgi:hypothetical protein